MAEPYIVKVLLISGGCGTGKTTTAYEICHQLRLKKMMHVHIPGDGLDSMYPCDDDEVLLVRSLRAVWSSFWQEACRWWIREGWAAKGRRTFTVVLDGTALALEQERIINTIAEGINQSLHTKSAGMDVRLESFTFILEADQEIVSDRLHTREKGSELEEHLESTQKMARVLRESDLKATWIQVDSKAVVEVAAKILQHCNT